MKNMAYQAEYYKNGELSHVEIKIFVFVGTLSGYKKG